MEEASNGPILEFRELGDYTFDLREGGRKVCGGEVNVVEVSVISHTQKVVLSLL